MGDPKFEPNKDSEKSFGVEKYPVRNGFIYELYFATEAEAEEAIKAFWNAREGSEVVQRGLQSGMLKPSEHEITGGDRTFSRNALSRDLVKHPDKPCIVQFNGNTEALSPKGEAALRQLGFIE